MVGEYVRLYLGFYRLILSVLLLALSPIKSPVFSLSSFDLFFNSLAYPSQQAPQRIHTLDDDRNRTKTPLNMLPIIILSLFALHVHALEPPFAPAVVQELNRLSNLPSLISTEQLLAGISPADLAAFLASASTDTTNNSQPNPIAQTFPNMTTGTINGSFVVLPLDYGVARAIVPSKFGILRQSIKAVLPFFPEDKYPVRTFRVFSSSARY